MSAPSLPLIPYPHTLIRKEGTCRLGPDSAVLAAPGADDLALWAAPLLDLLRRGTGLALPMKSAVQNAQQTQSRPLKPLAPAQFSAQPPPAASITLARLTGQPAEATTLDITENAVVLRAGDREGTVWGLQTLRQLLPVEVEQPLPAAPRTAWPLPCLHIADRPRFAWRGLLLDSCRHFQDIAAIERLIDLMSLHKLNRLHWHLTEDQGWRLEIRSRPELTEVAAWRTDSDGRRYGGFYTQDEARHVVAYAAARGVTVVPEIELPGHCQAALAAYPQLSCRGEALAVQTEWGVFADIYCAGNDAVFSFLEDVLTEVLDIFPSTFIHLGGDECPPDRWLECPRCQERMAAEGLRDTDALHGWFVQRMVRWLADRGRRAIGWDEILAGGLADGAVVQSWRGFEGAMSALAAGHDTIVSPISHMYLDQDIARVSVQTVLSFEPEVAAANGCADGNTDGGDRGNNGRAGRILGGEMCLWTERIPQAVIDERLFPRMCAGSEVLWRAAPAGGAGKRDLTEFLARLEEHGRRLRALGVRIGP